MSGESVDIDEFDAADPEEFERPSASERILAFLADHDDRAWKASAVAEGADVNPDSVSTLLGRLRDKGLVRHKEPYWAITDDEERLAAASSLHAATERLDERYGEEDPDDWFDGETQ